MKTITLSIILSLFICNIIDAQGIAINTSGINPDSTAILDVSSTTKGVLIPRMNQTEVNAIVSPANGLMIFNTSSDCFNIYKSGSWFEICGNCIAPAAPVASSNSPVCEGDTVKLYASTISGCTYTWSGPNGFSSSLQNPVIPNSVSASAGSYQVYASSGGCNSGNANTSVTITSLPASTFTHNPTTGAPAQNVDFSPTLTGATYSWVFSGGSPATSTAQNPTVQWASSGTYAVTLTVTQNGCSSVTIDSITISSSTVLNTYNYTGHEYLIDCDMYSCGITTMQAAICFCQANGYSTAISYSQQDIYTTDCFGYSSYPGCTLQASWCGGGSTRHVVPTVTCQ